MPPSNVLHVTDEMTAGVLGFLALATRELLEAGVQQTLLYSGGGATSADVVAAFNRRVRLVDIGRPLPGVRRGYQRALREALQIELRACRYDAVHLHAARAGFVGRLALGTTPQRPPLYYSPHGLASLNRQRPMAGAMAGFLERVAGLSPCVPVAGGHGEAAELKRLTGREAAVLENPVDESFFGTPRCPDARPRVVAVGRVCAHKGPARFAELAARFHFAGEPARFVWVGAGDPVYEQALRAAGVELTGWVSQAEVSAQLARAQVYVQPSLWEGMALPVLQAMAAGLPCVVTDVVGNRDAVAHGRTGLLAHDVSDLALQVKWLLDHPQRAGELGAAARRDAQRRFHPQRFRRALLSLYRLRGEVPAAADAAAPDTVAT